MSRIDLRTACDVRICSHRVGEDEFAILLTKGANLAGARAQAGLVLDALREPFALDPITLRVDA